MLIAKASLTSVTPPLAVPSQAVTNRRPLHIVEAKVFAQLDAGEKDRNEMLGT